MRLDFDRGTDSTNPVSVYEAVERGQALVNRPVKMIMAGVGAIGAFLLFVLDLGPVGFFVMLSAPFVAWIWWSYAAPRWRHWALTRGADPDNLQKAAERARLLWPRGHFLERTEFPFKGA